jgi:hypothetical protein
MQETYRAYIEVAPGEFQSVEERTSIPRRWSGLLKSYGLSFVVLSGLAPVLGPDVLLKLCRQVIEEDRPS